MAGNTNTKQLRDNLANYDAQLDQVRKNSVVTSLVLNELNLGRGSPY